MDPVIRAAVTYFIVWLIFRISGKRSLAQVSTFDFALLFDHQRDDTGRIGRR
jgi:uncharacterized membrane protein YcaP (DUF421 family)